MIELSPTDRALYRLAYQQSVLVPLADVPAALQLPAAEAATALAELIADGHLELWAERKAVVLSVESAERLGVEIATDGRGRSQWHRKGSRAAERRHRAAAKVSLCDTPAGCPAVIRECDLRGDDGGMDLDALPGPTSVELADQGVPRLVLGLGPAWPVEHAPGERCRGCRHLAKMPTGSYCTLCHRSGSWTLRGVRPVDAAKPDAAPAIPAPRAQPCKRGAAPSLPTGRSGADPRPADALAGGIGKPPRVGSPGR